MPTNKEFLTALFGQNAPFVHVTDFAYDPSAIPPDEHLRAWAGGYFSRYRLGENTNQYFTISLFYADEKGKARRRKALFRETPVIVLDDVKEKLSMTEVAKLPRPTWILETSPGSEQWGYLLAEPCKDRAKVENLLDGLVANGLAPDGKDPGMKGVTRYVRLPEGVNTKQAKMINGQPFKCRTTLWEPFNTVTLEQLAEPFSVDLDASRREGRLDGAGEVSDHPLVNIPDVIHIKEIRSAGRMDITCPWVDEHTGEVDNGTGIFTNTDGTIGFKCHHGACQERTGSDLLRYIETKVPGFGQTLSNWQASRAFANVLGEQPPAPVIPTPPAPDFTASVQAAPDFTQVASAPTAPAPQQEVVDRSGEAAQAALVQLQRQIPGSIEQRQMATEILRVVDGFQEIDRVHWHKEIRDVMHWDKKEFNSVLKGCRAEWYAKSDPTGVFDDICYVGEINEFFDRRKRIFYKPEGFQNNFAHLDSEARKRALEGGITKVDKIDYSPKMPPVFERDGVRYANSWTDTGEVAGIQGDVDRWLNHWDALGWGEHRDHMLQWMAWTILHPETKINHMLLLGGAEGVGKDFLLYPLSVALGENHITVPGEALTSQFGDFILSSKHIHINEVSLADHRDAALIAEKIKPLAAAPPDKLYINRKGVKPVYVSNIINCSMGVNSTLPFKTQGLSRRIYGVWTDLQVRDWRGEMTPEWRVYWRDRWNWMKGDGVNACIWYLRNCVDLNNFRPSEAPPVTQFVRDINEASKPLLMQTIEAMMQMAFGCFKADIITAADVARSVKSTEQFAPDIAYMDTRTVTPAKVMNTLTNIRGIQRREVVEAHGIRKYWITRNFDHYASMTDEDFSREYARQISSAQGANQLMSILGGKQ